MRRLLIVLFGIFVGGAPALALMQAVTLYPKSRLLTAPANNAPRLATLNKGSVLRVLSRTQDGEYVKVAVELETQGVLTGYVLTRDVEFSDTTEFPESDIEHRDPYDPRDNWSFAFQFTLNNIDNEGTVTVSGSTRYLWTNYTETLVGLDFTVGQGREAIGPHLSQRFYWPLNRFRPFAQVGYRLFDVRDIQESALELGLGLQFNFTYVAYFDIVGYYLNNKLFHSPGGSDGFLAGLGLGLRF